MGKESLVLVGGGGHCLSCIEVVESTKLFEIKGILDRKENIGNKVLVYDVIGSDEDMQGHVYTGTSFLIAVGQIKSSSSRRGLWEKLVVLGAKAPKVISPNACVSRYAEILSGTIVMHHVSVNANVRIGYNCIVNTGAIIEHGVSIGDHCHISTGAIVNGDCVIGNNVFIGSNSVVANNVQIGNDTVIGAGSLVLNNIYKAGTYVGNPIKRIR